MQLQSGTAAHLTQPRDESHLRQLRPSGDSSSFSVFARSSKCCFVRETQLDKYNKAILWAVGVTGSCVILNNKSNSTAGIVQVEANLHEQRSDH